MHEFGSTSRTLCVIMLVALVLAGCGGSGSGVAPVSGSEEEASVKGTVYLRGKPLNNGRVLFNPVNIKRANVQARQAPINKDGSYGLKTLVGDNYVQIDCAELRQSRNREIADTERTVIVNSGDNTIDLKIPPE